MKYIALADVTNETRMEVAFGYAVKREEVTIPMIHRLPLHAYKNWLRRKLIERYFREELAENVTFVYER